jgi:hypothetical protein
MLRRPGESVSPCAFGRSTWRAYSPARVAGSASLVGSTDRLPLPLVSSTPVPARTTRQPDRGRMLIPGATCTGGPGTVSADAATRPPSTTTAKHSTTPASGRQRRGRLPAGGGCFSCIRGGYHPNRQPHRPPQHRLGGTPRKHGPARPGPAHASSSGCRDSFPATAVGWQPSGIATYSGWPVTDRAHNKAIW